LLELREELEFLEAELRGAELLALREALELLEDVLLEPREAEPPELLEAEDFSDLLRLALGIRASALERAE
jgi:hypothetical protein